MILFTLHEDVILTDLQEEIMKEYKPFKSGKVREVYDAGKLYSSEHNQSFSANGAICSLKQDREGHFDLNIDGVSRHSWFRRKKDEFMEALGLPTSRRNQNRGLKLD